MMKITVSDEDGNTKDENGRAKDGGDQNGATTKDGDTNKKEGAGENKKEWIYVFYNLFFQILMAESCQDHLYQYI